MIAGQSNSAGYGRGPYEDPSEFGVHLFRNSEQWALAAHPMNESTDTRHAVNREAANPGHSPYLQFARTLKRTLSHPVGLVQTSLGGSPLSRWNPDEPGAADLFDNMVRCVGKAGGKVRGIVWYQGESDTGTDADAASYAQRFRRALAAWREALAAPELPVLTVQLNRVHQPADPDADRRWSQVREAQRQAARQTPGVGPWCRPSTCRFRTRSTPAPPATCSWGSGWRRRPWGWRTAGRWPGRPRTWPRPGGGEAASNWSFPASRAAWTASTRRPTASGSRMRRARCRW